MRGRRGGRLTGTAVRALSWAAGLTLASACATAPSARGFDDTPAPQGTLPEGDAGVFDPGPGEVFGHSDNTLYRVETTNRTVTAVGFFQGCTHIADIALDEDSTMYASTGTELFYVEPNTARCTKIAEGTFPNSLSFVPAGTLEPEREVLVGFSGGDYVRIDPASGAVEKVGELGSNFEASGDVVSAKGGATFVTVKGAGCADCLVEIDPTTGVMSKNWGPLGLADVFGLAFWGGELYAFTNDGEVALVTFAGDVMEATRLVFADAPPGLRFWGAGSTTSAPLGPVR